MIHRLERVATNLNNHKIVGEVQHEVRAGHVDPGRVC